MPDLTDFPALDVAIGLAFLFFLLSLVCSAIQEAISSALALRAKTLEKGIRTLIADPAKAKEFYDDWRIKTLSTPKLLRKSKLRKPSYIPSRTFALTLIDTLVPDAANKNDKDLLEAARGAVKNLPDPTRKLLLDAVARADNKRNVFRGELEDAFNATMDRATGWYKRKIQIILFFIALAVSGGMNADAYNVAQRLFQDDALRAKVVAQALEAAKKPDPAPMEGETKDEAATRIVEERIAAARATALPLGWKGENVPDSVGGWFGKVGGILLTTFALMLGAPFWFDLLGRFAKLRSSGNRIGTPKDDEMAPVDRDERVAATTKAGSSPPPQMADLERQKNAQAEALARRRRSLAGRLTGT